MVQINSLLSQQGNYFFLGCCLIINLIFGFSILIDCSLDGKFWILNNLIIFRMILIYNLAKRYHHACFRTILV